MRNVLIKDLGHIDYMECLALQRELFDRLVAAKTGCGESPQGNSGRVSGVETDPVTETMILCEHPHVYTLGKSGREDNLLIDRRFLDSIGASCYRVDRGGDITYHGPGQLVGYPILDLEKLGIGLKEYVGTLEQAIITTLARFGLKCERCDGATGVWLPADDRGPLRKIAAIGVRSSHFVTMHGFALNVEPDMVYFSYIHPCGFSDRGVTSIMQESGRTAKMADVKGAFTEEFGKAFGIRPILSMG